MISLLSLPICPIKPATNMNTLLKYSDLNALRQLNTSTIMKNADEIPFCQTLKNINTIFQVHLK